MNLIFSAIIVLSLITAFFNGNIEQTVTAGLNGAAGSVETVLSFAGIMCMWSGFLKLCEDGGAMELVARLIRPVTRLLFPRLSSGTRAIEKICANISANLLGVGNAATPAGIEAMQELDALNKNPDCASDEMCIFTVMNTASIQLVPTTIIALRASFNSQNPQIIMLPIWISSFCALICAIITMRLILCIRRKRGRI